MSSSVDPNRDQCEIVRSKGVCAACRRNCNAKSEGEACIWSEYLTYSIKFSYIDCDQNGLSGTDLIKFMPLRVEMRIRVSIK